MLPEWSGQKNCRTEIIDHLGTQIWKSFYLVFLSYATVVMPSLILQILYIYLYTDGYLHPSRLIDYLNIFIEHRVCDFSCHPSLDACCSLCSAVQM